MSNVALYMEQRFVEQADENTAQSFCESAAETESNAVEEKLSRLERRRRMGDQIGVFYMSVIVPLTLGWIGFSFWSGWTAGNWTLGIGAPIVLGVIGAIFWAMGRTQRAGAELATLDDPRIVGALIDAYNYCEWDKRSEPAVRSRIIELLPRVDPGELTADQIRTMGRLLTRRHEDLCLALLEGLRRLGSDRSIPGVRRLTGSRNESIRDAAQTCMKELEARGSESSFGDRLLRPSSDCESAELLRPTRDIRPQELNLLQPADSVTESLWHQRPPDGG